MDTSMFHSLLLVNKTFHAIVSSSRREMRAYAFHLNTNATYLNLKRFKHALSNALVDPGAVLYGLCLELSRERREVASVYKQNIADLVLTNHKLFDSVIRTLDFPIIFETEPQAMSCASSHAKLLEYVPFTPRADPNPLVCSVQEYHSLRHYR
ncbi:hypothetical protein DFJ77DRAFT_472267 [Powellomyces hirtus]|nr:hypothetical protein DFJ77DRAFT_472267 [Powellomyces hirtus]